VRPIVKIFWIALVLKLILAAALPLTNDEAYYWVWAQNMQLSYYDHPPFVAWLYWLGGFTHFFPGGVRWPGVLLGHATLALWLILLKPFLSERQRLYWLLLALLSPLVGGSGIVVTPDVPLMFFYALSLWLYFIWLEKPDWRHSLAFGVAMGLGFSSKYMMVLFALSLLPLIFISSPLRQALWRNFPVLFVGAALGALPVWLWNLMHDFASLKFQAQHGLGNSFWKPSWTFEYIGVQIAFIFPIILYWALCAKRQLPLVFHFLAWIPLLFFLATTSRGYVEANWPIAAYPSIFALAVSSYPRNLRSLRATLTIWAILLATLLGVILAEPRWAQSTKFKEFHEFDQVIAKTRDLQPLYVRSYQMAAKMHYELGHPIYKLRGMNRRDFYDFLPESEAQGPLFYLVVNKDDRLPPEFHNYKKTAEIPIDENFQVWKMERQP
jgi:4-amino-4-deoxy-L-arabinose transferase-like glycosyltransferase